MKTDRQLFEDLGRIADEWNVPTSTAAYWLLRGLMADARGERFVMTGDKVSDRLALWMRRKFPEGTP